MKDYLEKRCISFVAWKVSTTVSTADIIREVT
jgi:hypothetical protein